MEYNRFVPYWQTKRQWDIHEEKLRKMQAVLNTTNQTSPKKYKSKNLNQSYDFRKLQIQMENKALLAKIAKKETSPNQTRSTFKDTKLKKCFRVRYFDEYDKQVENKDLLQKLKNIKTSYSTKMMAQSYKQNQKYMNLICKFPIKGLKPTKTFLKLDLINSRCKMHRRTQQAQYQNEERLQLKEIKNTDNGNNKSQKLKCQSQRKHIEKGKDKQRIKQMFGIQKLQLNGLNILVKGTHFTTHVLIRIMVEDQCKQLRVNNDQFETKYEGCFQKIIQRLGFNENADDFYLQ